MRDSTLRLQQCSLAKKSLIGLVRVPLFAAQELAARLGEAREAISLILITIMIIMIIMIIRMIVIMICNKNKRIITMIILIMININ